MKIADRQIGLTHKPFVIAEVAQAHDGSLGHALAFIEIAYACGADAIKFQTHIASEESVTTEPWRVPFSRQDRTRFDYWSRTGFSREQWGTLKERADELGIIFLSSPFSVLACDWLDELGIAAWKLASGEVHNQQLVERIAATKKPVIMSSGLSTVQESLSRFNYLRDQGCEVAILHCTTKYPTPPEDVGLNVLEQLSRATSGPTGLSDHTGTIYPSVVATYCGASVIEVHLTLHKKMFGPDTSSSLIPDELAQLIEGVNFAFRMRQSPVNKDSQLNILAQERTIFSRSLVAACDVAAGTVLAEQHLAYKKPGGGMAFDDRTSLLGKRTVLALKKDHLFTVNDVA